MKTNKNARVTTHVLDRRRPRSGFTLIEVIVSMGIIMVIIGLSLPALSKIKGKAIELSSEARLRQIGQTLVAHVVSHDGRMPESWEPVYRPTYADLEQRPFGDRMRKGNWWSNRFTYYFLFDEPLPEEVLRAPGFVNSYMMTLNGEPWSVVTDYDISESFFAEPSYWDHDTQQGEVQFRAQRVDRVRFPAQKGLMLQSKHHGVPGQVANWEAWSVDGYPNPVLWSDLSVTSVPREDLLETVVNAYQTDMLPPPVKWEPGAPVHNTKDGILGRDRK